MIPENFIEQWHSSVKWRTLPQVEQDLVISRALADLYNLNGLMVLQTSLPMKLTN